MSHPSSATFVECLTHLHHFNFVDCTVVALHYIRNINIVYYESTNKTYNKLNSKKWSHKLAKYTFKRSALHIGVLTHPHLQTITSRPFLCLRPLFPFPHPTNETETKLRRTWTKKNEYNKPNKQNQDKTTKNQKKCEAKKNDYNTKHGHAQTQQNKICK